MGKKYFAKISYYLKIGICQLMPHITHINWVLHIQTLDYMQRVFFFCNNRGQIRYVLGYFSVLKSPYLRIGT